MLRSESTTTTGRAAGITHLQDDVPGAQRGVGEDQRRVEPEDRLGVEVVAALGHQREVGGLGERGGHVAPDQALAEPELEDGAREGAVDVQRQDPAGVGDRDLGALGVGHRHGQLLLRVLGDRVDLGHGHRGGRPLPRADVLQRSDLGQVGDRPGGGGLGIAVVGGSRGGQAAAREPGAREQGEGDHGRHPGPRTHAETGHHRIEVLSSVAPPLGAKHVRGYHRD